MLTTDTRRINGPSSTISLSNFVVKPDLKALLDDNEKRADGRKWDEMRPIYLKAGIVQQANGSAYLETSGTKLISAVYGPRDNPKKHDFSSTGSVTCSLSYAPFSRKGGFHDNHDIQSKDYSNFISEALHYAICLESYPKAQIDVYINVLEDNGNTLSHAIMAASVGLVDAGIEMLDVVTSSSLVYSKVLSLLDPSDVEIQHPSIFGSLTVAYLPSLNQISGLIKSGEQDVDDSIKAINTCIEGCLRVHSVMKSCLVKSAMDKDG